MEKSEEVHRAAQQAIADMERQLGIIQAAAKEEPPQPIPQGGTTLCVVFPKMLPPDVLIRTWIVLMRGKVARRAEQRGDKRVTMAMGLDRAYAEEQAKVLAAAGIEAWVEPDSTSQPPAAK